MISLLKTWLILVLTLFLQSVSASADVVTEGSQSQNSACVATDTTLCLLEGRFSVEVQWRDHLNDREGVGHAVESTDRSGFFWFFNETNIELVVKGLDGRPVNDSFWFFYGALSDVEYTIVVKDTETGATKTYENASGNLCGQGDTSAFPQSLEGPSTSHHCTVRLPLNATTRSFHKRISFPASSKAGGTCQPDGETLCLLDGRFAVRVDWRNQHQNNAVGVGHPLPGSDRSGYFWFFREDNIELVVKALDGRAVNDRIWLFYGALSDVEYALTVTDTTTGRTMVYENPPGELCGLGDTRAFCDDPSECREGILLGSTTVQGNLQDPQEISFQNYDLGDDVDAVVLHQDFLGIPWAEFADQSPLPSPWVEKMNELQAWADQMNKPVLLTLALVQGAGREFLADRVTVEDGVLQLEDFWSARCMNLDTHPDGQRWKSAYLDYVRYMVEKFDPDYLGTAAEVNLFQLTCDPEDPGAYDSIVSLLNEAYDVAKEVKPWLPVFPTLQFEAIVDENEGGACYQSDPTPCIEHALWRHASMKRDRFAISAYPHLVEPSIPVDYSTYFDRVFELAPDEAFLFSETGYNSSPLLVDLSEDGPSECLEIFPYSPNLQSDYFEAVVSTSRKWNMDLLTWWSNRDLFTKASSESCPCEDPEGFCTLVAAYRSQFDPSFQGELFFKGWSTMGIRDWYGNPKPMMDRWLEVLEEERSRP